MEMKSVLINKVLTAMTANEELNFELTVSKTAGVTVSCIPTGYEETEEGVLIYSGADQFMVDTRNAVYNVPDHSVQCKSGDSIFTIF